MRAWGWLGLFLIVGVPHGRAEPIATTDHESPGIRLDVQELKRTSGGTVTLRFAVVNTSASDFPLNLWDSPNDVGTAGGSYLVDSVNRKKYEVVRDTQHICLCSRNLSSVPQTGTVNLWAKFPAPPEGVTKIGIVVPHFVPLDDVVLAQ